MSERDPEKIRREEKRRRGRGGRRHRIRSRVGGTQTEAERRLHEDPKALGHRMPNDLEGVQTKWNGKVLLMEVLNSEGDPVGPRLGCSHVFNVPEIRVSQVTLPVSHRPLSAGIQASPGLRS